MSSIDIHTDTNAVIAAGYDKCPDTDVNVPLAFDPASVPEADRPYAAAIYDYELRAACEKSAAVRGYYDSYKHRQVGDDYESDAKIKAVYESDDNLRARLATWISDPAAAALLQKFEDGELSLKKHVAGMFAPPFIYAKYPCDGGITEDEFHRMVEVIKTFLKTASPAHLSPDGFHSISDEDYVTITEMLIRATGHSGCEFPLFPKRWAAADAALRTLCVFVDAMRLDNRANPEQHATAMRLAHGAHETDCDYDDFYHAFVDAVRWRDDKKLPVFVVPCSPKNLVRRLDDLFDDKAQLKEFCESIRKYINKAITNKEGVPKYYDGEADPNSRMQHYAKMALATECRPCDETGAVWTYSVCVMPDSKGRLAACVFRHGSAIVYKYREVSHHEWLRMREDTPYPYHSDDVVPGGLEDGLYAWLTPSFEKLLSDKPEIFERVKTSVLVDYAIVGISKHDVRMSRCPNGTSCDHCPATTL